jgi:HSP20 family protein
MFAELERLQREMQQSFDLSPSIRGIGRGGFPALNAGGTPQTVDIYAFAPGLDPATIDLNLDRGVLTIAGSARPSCPSRTRRPRAHQQALCRPVSPGGKPADDVDPNGVSAAYRDGVLHISVKRRESAQPRRINVQ